MKDRLNRRRTTFGCIFEDEGSGRVLVDSVDDSDDIGMFNGEEYFLFLASEFAVDLFDDNMIMLGGLGQEDVSKLSLTDFFDDLKLVL